MNTDEIAKTLREYIVKQYAVPATDRDFTDDVHLFEYGYVDSFGAVDLLSFVEETFGITVGQADMIAYPMNTINEIAAFASLRQKGEV